MELVTLKLFCVTSVSGRKIAFVHCDFFPSQAKIGELLLLLSDDPEAEAILPSSFRKCRTDIFYGCHNFGERAVFYKPYLRQQVPVVVFSYFVHMFVRTVFGAKIQRSVFPQPGEKKTCENWTFSHDL